MSRVTAIVDPIFEDVYNEFLRATEKFGTFHNAHEGFAVLLEEVDELWNEIKTRNNSMTAIYDEAKQVAAMAIRIMHDCCKMEVSQEGEG